MCFGHRFGAVLVAFWAVFGASWGGLEASSAVLGRRPGSALQRPWDGLGAFVGLSPCGLEPILDVPGALPGLPGRFYVFCAAKMTQNALKIHASSCMLTTTCKILHASLCMQGRASKILQASSCKQFLNLDADACMPMRLTITHPTL